MLSEDYETLYRENRSLKEKLEKLSDGVQYYKSMEGTLQKALVLAEKTAKDTIEAANEKAELIEKEARFKADRIISEGNVQYENLRQQCLSLVQQYNQFKLQFKQIAIKQIELFDSDFYEIYTTDFMSKINESIDNVPVRNNTVSDHDNTVAKDVHEVNPQNITEDIQTAYKTVDNIAEEYTAQDNNVKDKTVKENAALEDAAIENAAIEDTALEDTAIEDTALEDNAIKDTAIDNTAKDIEYKEKTGIGNVGKKKSADNMFEETKDISYEPVVKKKIEDVLREKKMGNVSDISTMGDTKRIDYETIRALAGHNQSYSDEPEKAKIESEPVNTDDKETKKSGNINEDEELDALINELKRELSSSVSEAGGKKSAFEFLDSP
jgi:cell division initiation protein